MAYDEDLANRIRETLADERFTEKKMFGGLAFLIGGHMAVSASGRGGLMLRCDPAETEKHLANGAERMVMRGREMDGWLRVDAEDIEPWVRVGADYARSLPPKG
jgi:hypothetical protein